MNKISDENVIEIQITEHFLLIYSTQFLIKMYISRDIICFFVISHNKKYTQVRAVNSRRK